MLAAFTHIFSQDALRKVCYEHLVGHRGLFLVVSLLKTVTGICRLRRAFDISGVLKRSFVNWTGNPKTGLKVCAPCVVKVTRYTSRLVCSGSNRLHDLAGRCVTVHQLKNMSIFLIHDTKATRVEILLWPKTVLDATSRNTLPIYCAGELSHHDKRSVGVSLEEVRRRYVQHSYSGPHCL